MKDLRTYARQTSVRLALGGIGLIFILGLGLLLILYGPSAAASGLICLLTGLLPVGVILGILRIMEQIVQKQRR